MVKKLQRFIKHLNMINVPFQFVVFRKVASMDVNLILSVEGGAFDLKNK